MIAHILRGTGRSVALAGNIGVPVTELPREGLDYAVIEVSSYQAADFDGRCDLAVLTMLAQEHLDWHGSVAAYQRDKLNLLRHARHVIVNADARAAVTEVGDVTWFDPRADLHVFNSYLARPHNLSNLSAALAVAQYVGVDRADALRAAEDFQPLPHRQQEIGEIGGVLFVDDSISTTPESAVAALDVYRDRDVSIIIGGQDRGIDYRILVDRLRAMPPNAIILLDDSGRRIFAALAPSTRCPCRAIDARGGRSCAQSDAAWRRRSAVAGRAELWQLSQLHRAWSRLCAMRGILMTRSRRHRTL